MKEEMLHSLLQLIWIALQLSWFGISMTLHGGSLDKLRRGLDLALGFWLESLYIDDEWLYSSIGCSSLL
jgi:hypothetical protein